MRKAKHSGWWGYSLIEVAVVVIIIALISAIAVPTLIGSLYEAEVKVAFETLSTLRTAEKVYHLKFGRYGNFTDLADTLGIIDKRFSGGGNGPVTVEGIVYTFTSLPTETSYEITATTRDGTEIRLTSDGRIIRQD